MLDVEPVYSRLKDVTDGETTSVSRKESMICETTVNESGSEDEEKDTYVLRPGQGPLKSLGSCALYGCLEKSTPPLAGPKASAMRTEGVKAAARRMKDLKSSLNILDRW